MRKYLLLMTLAFAAMIAAGIAVKAQTYGPGYMMDPGYGGGYGPSPGYMMGSGYGYDRDGDRGVRRQRGYRGQRMYWHETNSDRGYGYYEPCR